MYNEEQKKEINKILKKAIPEIYENKKHRKCNCYLTGSRIYGTAKEKADYDFFIIIEDKHFEELEKERKDIEYLKEQWEEEQPKHLKGYQLFYKTHKMENEESKKKLKTKEDNILLNVNVYKKSLFAKKLRQNWLQGIMSLSIPKEKCIRTDIELDRKKYISNPKLGRAICGEASRHYQAVKKQYTQTNKKEDEEANIDHYQAKKYIIYALRDLYYGFQVYDKGYIENFQEPNKHYDNIMSDKFKGATYEKLHQHFRPIYEKKKKAFNERIKTLVQEKRTKKTTCDIKNYLTKKNIETCYRKFTIAVIAIQENIYHLTLKKEEVEDNPDIIQRWNSFPEVIEVTNGMVINTKTITPTIKYWGPEKELDIREHHRDQIQWENHKHFSIQIEKTQDESYIGLYWLEETWRICTRQHETGEDFKQQFDNYMKNKKYPQDKEACYTFVIKYPYTSNEIYFLCKRSLKEPYFIDYKDNTYKREEEYPIQLENEKRCLQAVVTLNPFEYKGLILRDTKTGQAIKIYSDTYINLKQLDIEYTSKIKIAQLLYDLIRVCDTTTLLDTLYKYLKIEPIDWINTLYEKLLKYYNDITNEIQQIYAEAQQISDEKQQRQFLKEKNKKKHLYILQNILNMKKMNIANVKDYFKTQPYRKLPKLPKNHFL